MGPLAAGAGSDLYGAAGSDLYGAAALRSASTTAGAVLRLIQFTGWVGFAWGMEK